ncbi:YgiT-type zinc finger protein [Paenibacillus chartarius]|uniref:YgiT-type zinc finger protein n=1 Tax=Paenibacillus chartarius TaxID=747481 RepID=A0ABV6DHH2_9BACL
MLKISQCVFCGCLTVPPARLEIPVRSNKIKSIQADGAKCSQCGEEYYDAQTMRTIEELEKA